MAKILFLVTEDYYFRSHRLPLAKALVARGHEVLVITRLSQHQTEFKAAGLRVISWNLRRRSANPFQEWRSLSQVVDFYRRERPDLVHHVALKPILYGGLAAWWTGVPRVVQAVAGLGHLFTGQDLKTRLLGGVIRRVYWWLFRRSHCQAIFQNPEDLALFVDTGGVPAKRCHLIRGAGVDIEHFTPLPEPTGPVTFLLASRLLWSKGVGDYVEAARRLRDQGRPYQFLLAGDPDPANPASVPLERLRAWQTEGVVEWLGGLRDMREGFAKSHVVCLPSYYGEGLPKVLLEAAACARPLVATAIPGCREIVAHNLNGLRIPPRDPGALALALDRLGRDPVLRVTMGRAGRWRTETEFATSRILDETFAVYRAAGLERAD